jgi:hypothetical protein
LGGWCQHATGAGTEGQRAALGVSGTVWPGRRRQRIRRLEDAVAQAQAQQAELARRLALFEEIAAAAGLEMGEPSATTTVPPSLLAAARDPGNRGASVRLDVDGHEVIAVVGGERGDPREWWAAIRHVASRLRNAS